MITKTRPLDALLVGVAAATIAGLGWWASVAFTERLFIYAAIVVGIVVGQGVLIGARMGGVLPALIAGALTLVALVAAQYFIERSLAISNQGAEDLPLWLGFSTAKEVVRSAVDADATLPLFWLLSVGAALVGAGSRSRRPAI